MDHRWTWMLLAGVLGSCGPEQGAEQAPMGDRGALVAVSMESSVGVLLDELPEAERDRAAAQLLAADSGFWQARARMQLEAALYRLVYRQFYVEEGGQLPLPPKELWQIEVDAPQRTRIDGHDLVVVPYRFASTLLTGAEQPGLAEARLAQEGGVHQEAFVLPADPDLLLERTGFACVNESDFPPNSVDTENVRSFYDDTCLGGQTECHVTMPAPAMSCVEALEAHVGRVTTSVRFERLRWEASLADAVRVGRQVADTVQLKAVSEGVEDHRIVYRYFAQDSCAIAEGCVGGPGWRRLLQFTATMQNLGALDAALGDVGPDSAPVRNNMVSMSECHGHMHFNHYGNFTFGDGQQQLGSKRAFCLESTARYFNNEQTPLVHPYGCDFQGTAAGWGDDYIAGLDCQWVDITSVDARGGVSAPLVFHVNPDGFICEGKPILDAQGELTFETTTFIAENGLPEARIACEETDGWESDNIATATVEVPEHGGLVTSPCTRGQLGEKRNCGFVAGDVPLACEPGEPVRLRCTSAQEALSQVVRVCEYSQALSTGTACLWHDALASGTVHGSTTLEFGCPAARDATEPGGRLLVYTAPQLSQDPRGEVRCELEEAP